MVYVEITSNNMDFDTMYAGTLCDECLHEMCHNWAGWGITKHPPETDYCNGCGRDIE